MIKTSPRLILPLSMCYTISFCWDYDFHFSNRKQSHDRACIMCIKPRKANLNLGFIGINILPPNEVAVDSLIQFTRVKGVKLYQHFLCAHG